MFKPLTLDLQGLFRAPAMFDSNHNWRKEGFDVTGEGGMSDIMVASHPSAPGHLFKKYSSKISLKEQLKNYRRRVEGAEKLKVFVADRQLTKIAVPQKYLHVLPGEFARKGVSAYVLVVERLVLLKSSESKRLYRQITNEDLRQLCAVLSTFRGLDSGVRNVPFTDGRQIAFIDTERWDKQREGYLRRIRAYLSEEQLKFAETLFRAPAR